MRLPCTSGTHKEKNKREIANTLSYFFLYTLAIAFTYFYLGLTAEFFTLELGQFSVINPQTGFALLVCLYFGGKALFGIGFGAFFVYINFFSLSWSQVNLMWFAPLLIASSVVLQIYIAMRLIKQFILLQPELFSFKTIVRLITIFVPITCLVTATISLIVFHFTDFKVNEGLLNIWAIWWLADFIGTMIFIPIIIAIVFMDTRFKKLISFLINL